MRVMKKLRCLLKIIINMFEKVIRESLKMNDFDYNKYQRNDINNSLKFY